MVCHFHSLFEKIGLSMRGRQVLWNVCIPLMCAFGCNIVLRMSNWCDSNMPVLQLTPWGLRLEQIYAQLQHERMQVAQERLHLEYMWRQVEHGRKQLVYESLQFADVRCAVLKHRVAREGKTGTVAGCAYITST